MHPTRHTTTLNVPINLISHLCQSHLAERIVFFFCMPFQARLSFLRQIVVPGLGEAAGVVGRCEVCKCNGPSFLATFSFYCRPNRQTLIKCRCKKYLSCLSSGSVMLSLQRTLANLLPDRVGIRLFGLWILLFSNVLRVRT